MKDFENVYQQILKVAPAKLAEKLERDVNFWAPESRWFNLTRYVNAYVTPSSRDHQAIAVYALLYDCSEDEMKKKFCQQGV